MNKYLSKLKESPELRRKMTLDFETGYSSSKRYYEYTVMTDSDAENESYDTYVDVKTAEIMWDGYDPEYKVVSVIKKKYVNQKLIDEKRYLAVMDSEECYYYVPNTLARKEGLEA